jgi:hypothetical protein
MGHLEDPLQGCADSGSAPQNKPFVASTFFADHFSHSAHNQDKQFQMSEMEQASTGRRGTEEGKIFGRNSLFIRFSFCKMLI